MLDKEKIIAKLASILLYNDEYLEDLYREMSILLSVIKNGHYDIKPEAKETCRWKFILTEGYYDTECGKGFSFDDNYYQINYCPYCSKQIQVVDDE